jgi:hypothetical protein
MSANRHRTLRKSQTDLSGGAPPGSSLPSFEFNPTLESFLSAEAGAAYKKPWHRLERGLRLNRLRAFSEKLAGTRGLKPGEQAALLQVLTRALDRKVLNSKLAVNYDAEKEEILEIKPLIMHQNAAGEVLFQILERRNNVTFRRRSGSAGPEGERP